MGHKGGPTLRRAHPERQVQDRGCDSGFGAVEPRRWTDDPHLPPRVLLSIPDGDPTSHGACVLRGDPDTRR